MKHSQFCKLLTITTVAVATCWSLSLLATQDNADLTDTSSKIPSPDEISTIKKFLGNNLKYCVIISHCDHKKLDASLYVHWHKEFYDAGKPHAALGCAFKYNPSRGYFSQSPIGPGATLPSILGSIMIFAPRDNNMFGNNIWAEIFQHTNDHDSSSSPHKGPTINVTTNDIGAYFVVTTEKDSDGRPVIYKTSISGEITKCEWVNQ